MPLFAIIAYDKPGSGALRAETRPVHLGYLREIEASIKVAGPIDDDAGQPIGSLIIAGFDDLAAARAFADADPYAKAGLFAEVRVAPWRQVLPAA
jgi:uncharacterized protein YciI